ncbi:MAG: ABC transporter substrate-binding protein [Clostridiaceae bacterium]
MKKILAILITVSILAVGLVGCGKSDESVNSLDRVKDAGKITIGLEDTYPPMEYHDEDSNELMGFDIDLGNEIASKLGVEADFISTDFNGISESLKASKFDIVISCLSITDKRKKTINFSDSYLNGGQIVVVKAGSDIKTVSDLNSKILACQLGSTGEKAANTVEGTKEVKSYNTITDAFNDLNIGRVDAVVVDVFVASYYLTELSDQYTVLDEELTEEPVGVGFNKNDPELQEAVQTALDELLEDGTMSTLSVKWFGKDYYAK